jgi:Vault protein inter-alpha-trypsin domain
MRRMLLMLFGMLTVACLSSSPVQAQSNPSLTAYERGVDDNGDETKEETARLKILSMRVDARIQGKMADITMQIGTTSQVADEARLALAMPSDAVVTGYALDVGGQMIEGELLDQPKARNVYEDEVRKGIDPGLAEVTQQNQFRSRIFPVTPDNPRRFRMRFSAPFDPAKGIVLPLVSAAPVTSLAFTLRADGYAVPPVVQLGSRKLALTRQGGGWIAVRKDSMTNLPGDLVISGGELRDPLAVSRHGNG